MSTTFAEVNRQRRGHAFLPPKADLAKVPALYEQDGKGKDAIVHIHYFVGSADWYITEINPETYEAFGWAEILPGGGELGYIDLGELEAVKAHGFMVVERDKHWRKKSLREALKERV